LPERLTHRFRVGCLEQQQRSLAVARQQQSDQPDTATRETPRVRPVQLRKLLCRDRHIEAELSDDVDDIRRITHVARGTSANGAHLTTARGAPQMGHQMGTQIAHVIFGTMHEARLASPHEVESEHIEARFGGNSTVVTE
jgi:hypothetical protein